ncbi:MAG: cation transporter [Candidatus Dormibacteria bacterium]
MSTRVTGRGQLVRQALVAQVLTASWMIVEGAVAILTGVAARSVALTAFGIDSGIEIFTAVVVFTQLRGEDCNGHGEYTAAERRATRLVGYGLWGLIAYIVVSTVYTLTAGVEAEPSTLGIVLALAVLVVMPGLWWWRRRLAERLDNPGLRADVACSVVCIYMAVTLLGGLVLNRAFGWWWADPLAGLAMMWWIRREASEALQAARTGRHCEC